MLKSYRKDWDEHRGVWMSKPRHDWASHGADAFRTGAVAPDPMADLEAIEMPNYAGW